MAHPTIDLFLSSLALCSAAWFATSADEEPSSTASAARAEETREEDATVDFGALKQLGARLSRYRTPGSKPASSDPREPDLESFQAEIFPILRSACLGCHGPEKSRGGMRIDELDPDLVHGEDVDWWLDVQAVLSNGEMPPPEENKLASGASDLAAEDRGRVIEWLSGEVQVAAAVRKGQASHSPLRRMTRYEYEYALQDLLGLPFPFADDLPPDPVSEDGFQNSSDLLHLSSVQMQAYLDSARKALLAATVRGEQPEPLSWSVTMEQAAGFEHQRERDRIAQLRKNHAQEPTKLEEALARLREQAAKRPGGAHYESLASGKLARQSWGYGGAKFAWSPLEGLPDASRVPAAPYDHVAIIPRRNGLIVELGNRIPARGTLRVAVLASQAGWKSDSPPILELKYGWQASNDSRSLLSLPIPEQVVEAEPGAPQRYEFEVALERIYPRNGVRTTAKMGDLPNPSEYIKLINSARSGDALRVHHVEVTAPVFAEWPPASHRRVFPERSAGQSEREYARSILDGFMARAWRRPVDPSEVERKLALFDALRPESTDLQEAMIEVLATVLSSPHFLLVGMAPPADDGVHEEGRSPADLASRLALFLWCSTPDEDLIARASRGELASTEALQSEVERMLRDPRAERFSRHFVRQWLNLSLLDYLQVDKQAHPRFDTDLREAMLAEPLAFFQEVLQQDLSALEFLHADFTMANERLAEHYGLEGVTGNHMRRVPLADPSLRGGLLTQPGLLAMNSDGKDSHPLKRGVWLLERLLDDPPPPPPPAVPEIDLADPEIAKMTLKERIEDHRNDPACLSCHAKIDPWGIAFEAYDATGLWRTEVQGRPVDATSVLFNGQQLDGMVGLKSFLLEHRQDQFIRALVTKLSTFALGRELSFGDQAALDEITAEVRRRGDGLATMIVLIVTSELFRYS